MTKINLNSIKEMSDVGFWAPFSEGMSDILTEEDFKPESTEKQDTYKVPEGARNNAKKVLAWKKEHGKEVKGMTETGWRRARQLANNSTISLATVKKMAAFARHKKNSEVAAEFKSTPWKDAGYVAWLGWGGTTGIEWAQKISEANKGSDVTKRGEIPSGKPLESMFSKELRKIISGLNLTRKPTPQELDDITRKLAKQIDKKLRVKGANSIKAIYNKASKKVASEFSTKFTSTPSDKVAIDSLKQDPKYLEAFAGVSQEVSMKVRERIESKYDALGETKGVSVDEIEKEIKGILSESKGQIKTIARTELAKISNRARYEQYNKRESFRTMKFKHIGPVDNRTTPTSKRIMARTQNGVSWNEYVQIVKDESSKDFPDWTVDETAPVSHYNSRHTFIRVVE